MDYMQRLVQRSSSEALGNLLWPNANGWADLFDPFENTRFMAPVMAIPSRRHRAVAVSPETGGLPPALASNAPVADHRAVSTQMHPFEPVEERRASFRAFESAPDILHHVVSAKSTVPVPSSKEPAPADRIDAVAEPMRGVADRRERDQNSAVSARRPKITQPQTSWIRRYISDMNPPGRQGKQPLETQSETAELPQGLRPRRVLPQLDAPSLMPAAKPSAATAKRPAAGKQPSQAPRLVIGRLNVDVVPVQIRKPAYRRTVPLRKRPHSPYGRLTQAEAARMGFGIGQM